MKQYKLYEQLRKRHLKAGELVFTEGDEGDYAYIIEEGEIEIFTEVNGMRSLLNTLGQGNMFGELALVDGRPRSASAMAHTDAILTLITPEQVKMRLETTDPILRMLLLVVMRYFRSETSYFRRKFGEQTEPKLPQFTSNKFTPKQFDDLSEGISDAVAMIRLESELRIAIDERQFTLFYQPILNLQTGNIAGFEALIRWEHPKLGLVSPNLFMPLAESTSLIVPLGKWIIQEALLNLKKLQEVAKENVFISINIASRQIEEVDLSEFLLTQVKEIDVHPSQIKLEILERSLFDTELASAWIEKCRSLGFSVVLDDFGTGYSSLGYLIEYQLDGLKIDKSFIRELDNPLNTRSHSICRAIINLSNSLNITVVAEGIENQLELNVLKDMGCHFGQGYLFSKPVPLSQAIALLD